MSGFILPNKIFCCCQVSLNALYDLFEFACLNLNCGCLPKINLLVAFIYFAMTQKYLFKNTTLKLTYGCQANLYVLFILSSIKNLFYFNILKVAF